MKLPCRIGLCWLVLFALVGLGACKPQEPAPQPVEPAPAANDAAPAAEPAGEPSADGTAAAQPPAPEPPPKPTIPNVVLSEEQKATNLVQVGDRLPETTLPNLAGETVDLKSLRGERLTVVVFWAGDDPYAEQEIGDLQADVADDYADKGVRVVGVYVGGAAEAAGKQVGDQGVKYPVVLDADQAYFQKVATKHLPRTYVLDAEGKVLWLDLGYSESTLRDLLQTIEAVLLEAPPAL